MKKVIFTISVCLTSLFLSCNSDSSKYNSELAITGLTQKFPQLPRGKGNQTAFYRHIRTVYFGNNGSLQMQLWATPDSIKDKQEILILVNEKKQSYALPLFSNRYKTYWNFEFETSPIDGDTPINTTFEKEIISALDSLGFKTNPKTCTSIMLEFLVTMMRSELVREQDAKDFDTVTNCQYDTQQVETYDNCVFRQRKNFNAILKEIRPDESFRHYNAYWDKDNNRIYQVFNKNYRDSTKYDCYFKIYRQDCNSENIDL